MSEYIVDVGDADEKHVQLFKTQATSLFGHPINEQVVRCKDCWNYSTRGKCYHWMTLSCFEEPVPSDVDPNGFCAWGKRRDA